MCPGTAEACQCFFNKKKLTYATVYTLLCSLGGRVVQGNNSRIRRRLRCLFLIRFFVSVARGLVISGILILLLPILAGANALWFAMPITKFLVAIYAAMRISQLSSLQTTPKTAS